MTRKDIILLVAFIHIFSCCCSGGSIWAKRGANATLIYSDDKATQIGDILTIIISEDSKIKNKVERDLEKKTSRTLAFDDDQKIDVGDTLNGLIPDLPSFNLSASSHKKLEGQSDYKDERTFEDKITVVVEDIHPNGNLVVIGTRHRDIGGDMQTIQVSGIVRTRDIAFDNTIRSEQVAQFKLVTINKGVTQNYNNPGWLAKVLDMLWPL
jgi:flagellar L-ring protein precursor FlgH